MKIADILKKYDSDKNREHHYGGSYDNLFSRFDRNAKLNILEIGTQKGGSLCAWQDYFPNANITGVDIVDVVKPEYRRDTINYVISDIKKWKTDMTFDIIIDDGSHFLGDMIYTLSEFVVKLKPNGVYVIEDIRDVPLHVKVVENILSDISIPYPDFKGSFNINVRDCRVFEEGELLSDDVLFIITNK